MAISLRKTFSFLLRHAPGAQFIPDGLYIKMLYFLIMRKRLNLRHPEAFTEKMQWLKINDRKPHHVTMVDKYAVKSYVEAIAGKEILIPTLGIWDSFDDIDFDSLPDKFVLKTTHGGGGLDVVIVKDKRNFDFSSIRARFNRSLKKSLYAQYREWPYKGVPRKIIAEAYMEDEFGELRDYKFFCMNGEPKFMYLATGRMGEGELTFDFLDMDYKRIPVKGGHPLLDKEPEPPKNLDKMIELARKLSAGEIFVRVDLYNVKGKIYFGEYTFFHDSGLVPFDPDEYDLSFGNLVHLPVD